MPDTTAADQSANGRALPQPGRQAPSAAEPSARTSEGAGRGWTFLTNHAHVLLALARNPEARLREVADLVGITERAAQAIVADLEKDGYLHRTRVGRRNHYTINPAGPFRHPIEAHKNIGDLLALFTPSDQAAQEDDTDARPQT